MVLWEQPAQAPKDSNLNPQAVEQQQSVCIQNFASPSDLNFRFGSSCSVAWLLYLKIIWSPQSIVKKQRQDLHQPISQGVSTEWAVSETSLEQPGSRTQPGLPWYPAAAASLAFLLPLCHSPGTDCAKREAVQLQTAGTGTWHGDLARSPGTRSPISGALMGTGAPPALPCSSRGASSFRALRAAQHEGWEDLQMKIFDLPEQKALTDTNQGLWWDLVYQASVGLEIDAPKLLWPEIRLT